MDPGKTVFEGKTNKGRDIFVRYALASDAEAFCRYINMLSAERTFVLFQGEQVTLEEEQEYVDGQVKRIVENKTIQLAAFCNGEVRGIAAIDMQDRVASHVGAFGIFVTKVYRGEGIGRLLMGYVLREAEENIPQLHLVTLGVFGDNAIAIGLYKSFGFKEYGRLPNGILHNNVFVDHIYMYKSLSGR